MSGILGAASSGSIIQLSSSLSFTISPAVSGKSTWNTAVDGPLNLGSYGTWTIVPSNSATVSLNAWGAGGGGGGYAYNGPTAAGAISAGTVAGTGTQGGAGGYAGRTVTLIAGTTYIIQVGEGGYRTMAIIGGATHRAGGTASTTKGGILGGGYTGLFASSVSQANALLVAGGGGGGSATSFGGTGGGGGGTAGQNGNNSPPQAGYGGSQTAGGLPASYNGATAGSALTGGMGAAGSQPSMGGGGGGYFGGGGGNVGGGGGGSGYAPGGTLTNASGPTPGNSAHALRAGAGTVTAANSAGTGGIAEGSDGRFVLSI